jgi:hypothetical protein
MPAAAQGDERTRLPPGVQAEKTGALPPLRQTKFSNSEKINGPDRIVGVTCTA